MARPLRLDFPDALHHITSRGNEGRPVFKDDVDRRMFCALLGETVRRYGWSITAWVLMTNHFHLIIRTPEPTLSQGMHWLNGKYVAWFNRRHRRRGHLYQGRFDSVLIEDDAHLREALRYVVLNPVRAGMVHHPETYRWSSYRASVGLDPVIPWLDTNALMEMFDVDPQNARNLYRDFVAAKIGSSERLWDQLINGMYLGGLLWAKSIRKLVESRPRSSDHPEKQRAIGRPMMHEIVAAVAQASQQTADELREQRGTPQRRLVAWIGFHEGLVTLRSIAASLLLRSEGHVSNMIRRCEKEFSSDPSLLKQMDLALATLRA